MKCEKKTFIQIYNLQAANFKALLCESHEVEQPLHNTGLVQTKEPLFESDGVKQLLHNTGLAQSTQAENPLQHLVLPEKTPKRKEKLWRDTFHPLSIGRLLSFTPGFCFIFFFYFFVKNITS